MITAVDTNVILDVLKPDVAFAHASQEALRRCEAEGRLVACEQVWAEVAAWAPSPARFHEAMELLRIEFVPASAATAAAAGEAWHAYRRQGGTRERLVADFLIGAHAAHHAQRLLTRDRGFYRRYFAKLALVDPTARK